MKYYKLAFSNRIKVVGRIPQSEEGVFGDIQKDFIPYQGTIGFDFKLPEPKLEKKAKQISFLDVTFIPSLFLVIEDELLSFLKGFNIGNHQNWKIKTWQNNKLIEKYNLFIINDTKQDRYIDFAKSEFRPRDYSSFSTKLESVYAGNYEEYVTKKEQLRKDKLMFIHNSITLDLRKASEDMFRLVNVPLGGYFVSERLKNAIEEKGFMGMEFTEVSELKKAQVIY